MTGTEGTQYVRGIRRLFATLTFDHEYLDDEDQHAVEESDAPLRDDLTSRHRRGPYNC